MSRALALAAALAASGAASAAAPSARKPAPLARASGRIAKAEAGRLTLSDETGVLGEFILDAATKITCDGRKTAAKAAAPGACDRALKVLYDAKTRRVRVLELSTTLKSDMNDAKTRPSVSGEIAATDVLAGTLSVRLGGGSTLPFKVGDAAKILRETEGKAPEPVPFESLKVGERVDVRSADWKSADEILVRSAR